MAVPKKKTSKSRRDRRRAHHDKISTPAVSNCAECGEPTPPHQACVACGVYRGRQVIEIEDDETDAESEE